MLTSYCDLDCPLLYRGRSLVDLVDHLRGRTALNASLLFYVFLVEPGDESERSQTGDERSWVKTEVSALTFAVTVFLLSLAKSKTNLRLGSPSRHRGVVETSLTFIRLVCVTSLVLETLALNCITTRSFVRLFRTTVCRFFGVGSRFLLKRARNVAIRVRCCRLQRDCTC